MWDSPNNQCQTMCQAKASPWRTPGTVFLSLIACGYNMTTDGEFKR